MDFHIDLADSYGSHCDNGEVTITNINNVFLLFVNDSATGGEIRVEIPINECKNAILEIANKYFHNHVDDCNLGGLIIP